jgi:hypothetical protein
MRAPSLVPGGLSADKMLQHHVFLRVYWLYRPEDLPGGRQSYHGANELIASNDMDIIDAMTVNGGAKVVHWQEQKDKTEILNPEQLFWRQTLDVAKPAPRLSVRTPDLVAVLCLTSSDHFVGTSQALH